MVGEMKATLGSARTVFGWSFALARSLTMTCVACVPAVLRGDTVKIDIHYILHYY